MQTLYYLYVRASVQAAAQSIALSVSTQYGERDLEALSEGEIFTLLNRTRFYLGLAGNGATINIVDPRNPDLVTVRIVTPVQLKILGSWFNITETGTARREKKV
jgi:hypothetical protein